MRSWRGRTRPLHTYTEPRRNHPGATLRTASASRTRVGRGAPNQNPYLPPPNRFLPDDLSILPPAPPTPAAADDDAAADAADADADGASASASAAAAAGLYRPRGPTRLSSLDAAGRTVWRLDSHLP